MRRKGDRPAGPFFLFFLLLLRLLSWVKASAAFCSRDTKISMSSRAQLRICCVAQRREGRGRVRSRIEQSWGLRRQVCALKPTTSFSMRCASVSWDSASFPDARRSTATKWKLNSTHNNTNTTAAQTAILSAKFHTEKVLSFAFSVGHTKIQCICFLFFFAVPLSNCNFCKSPRIWPQTHVCNDLSLIGQNKLGWDKIWKVNNHVAPACCTCCAYHDLFDTITSKIWTIWGFCCNANFMTRCLSSCNIEVLLQEGYEWELWLLLTLIWMSDNVLLVLLC